MSDVPLKIIQISDTHLFANPNDTLLGVPTQKSLEAVLKLIKEKAQPFDLIIHSGDLTQDYSKEAYQRLADMLSQFNVPVYCVPGNHDDPVLMFNSYPRGRMTNEKHIVTDDWQIILLNSHKPKSVDGFLSTSQLSFLDTCLQSHPNHFSILVFHHHPVAVQSEWLDKIGLQNQEHLWQVIAKYSKLKIILFGHVHQQYECQKNHIACYSVPSTCIQFMKNHDEFALENIPQGFRWLYLYQDGRFETGVERLNGYIGDFDSKAEGY